MTLSIWRYAHLTFAIFSCIFLALLSFTGIVLAIDAIDGKIPAYNSASIDQLTIADIIPSLKKTYPEIIDLSIDRNGFVTLHGSDTSGHEVNAFIHPASGKILGHPEKQSEFVRWNLALHRSLFLKKTGRVMIGIASFLLILISISGIALVLQRQEGWRRFFSKIVRENFASFYHVLLGRWSLIPILILALTGTFLSMEQLELIPKQNIEHKITKLNDQLPSLKPQEFPLFRSIKLSEVQKIEFPFIEEDEEEHFTLKLNNRELVISQITGQILSEITYDPYYSISAITNDLHTGRTSIIWAVILIVACINILFFIYSGFTIAVSRKKTKVHNKFKPGESKIIFLFGSENGSTLRFANSIHQQLIANGHSSYLDQADNYTSFPSAQHLLIFTSTYGAGSHPSNAGKLLAKIAEIPQQQNIKVSIVGFGSHAYPDYNAFAVELHQLIEKQSWSESLLPLHLIDDKSSFQFIEWVNNFKEKTGIPLLTTPALFNSKPTGLSTFKVVEKSDLVLNEHTFSVALKPCRRIKFTSGDLLAVYPDNDNKERFYSIAKINQEIRLLVKFHPSGLGSTYLYALEVSQKIKARLIHNSDFHFPKDKKTVVMIANGTGIAPFPGMLQQHGTKHDCYLYCGFRRQTALTTRIEYGLNELNKESKLSAFKMAFSQEENHSYVMDLIREDAKPIAEILRKNGSIMICGSLAMQGDVESVLDDISKNINGSSLSFYKEKGQILSDCY